jgi:RNase P subunit RPR2
MSGQPPPNTPSDTVRIMCPNLTCRRVLAVPSTARGKTVRCKNCGTNIRVPVVKSSTTPDQPTADSKTNAA